MKALKKNGKTANTVSVRPAHLILSSLFIMF